MAKRGVRWSLQDAKAQFSEVVRRSLDTGPQFVTRNGEDAVVIVSVREFNRLSRPRAAGSLARFLADSPLADVHLDIARTRSSGRPVKL
jgi:prevent-host-death family protein